MKKLLSLAACILCMVVISAVPRDARAQSPSGNEMAYDCTSTPNIPLPFGGSFQVLPTQPIGYMYGSPALINGLSVGNCRLLIGPAPEDAEDFILDHSPTITFVLVPGPGFERIAGAAGVVLNLPNVTDHTGVGMALLTADGVPVDPNLDRWVVGTGGQVVYRNALSGTVVIFTPPFGNQNLSVQLQKVAEIGVPGNRRVGGLPEVFRLEWVLQHGTPHARVVHTSSVSMDTVIGVLLQAQGCRSTDLRRSLNRMRRADFTGPGTTYAELGFDLPIDCYGEPAASLSIEPMYPYAAQAGVGLADAAGSMGLGVQLLAGSVGETPWAFGVRQPLADIATTPDPVGGAVRRWTVSARARYFQLDTPVRTGQFLVNYTVSIHYD